MNGFARDASTSGSNGGCFGLYDGGMHAVQLVADCSMNDGSGAITVVMGAAIARKDIDNHRLAGHQWSASRVMTVGDVGRGSDDHALAHGKIPIQEEVRNFRFHTLTREWAAIAL